MDQNRKLWVTEELRQWPQLQPTELPRTWVVGFSRKAGNIRTKRHWTRIISTVPMLEEEDLRLLGFRVCFGDRPQEGCLFFIGDLPF